MAKCTVLVITAVTTFFLRPPPRPLSQGLDDRPPAFSEDLDPPLYL